MKRLVGRETEGRIIDAALALWHEGGIGSVTTRAVAARAGVNEVTVFRHFTSKDGLLQAMVQHTLPHCDMGADPDGQAQPDGFDLEQNLERWAQTCLEQVLPAGDVLLLGLVEARGRPDLAALCVDLPLRIRQELTDHLARLHAHGLIPAGPYEAVADMFCARLFVHALVHRVHATVDSDAVARDTARVCARALLYPSANCVPES